MASIIRIKRSSGTAKPLLYNGVSLVCNCIGSFGGTNQYKDRIFLGDDSTTIPSRWSLLYIYDGASTWNYSSSHNNRNSDKGVVAIMAPATNSGLGGESLKVNQWNDLRIDGNTFSTTDTDGDLILDPNGTGRVIISDDILSFGSDGDSSIEYDENGDNKVKVTGASWVYSNSVEFTSDSRF